MTSTWIKANGETKDVSPMNGTDFSLEEAQGFVGGYIEVVRLSPTQIMIVNEEGIIRGMRLNENASLIATMSHGFSYPIYGDVLVCPDEMLK